MKARKRRAPLPRPLDRGDARQYAAWFRTLADPTRVQIVSLLARAGGPLSVGEIVRATNVSQSTVSQHLKVLAEAGFASAERRGTANYYRLNDACVAGFPTAADLVAGSKPPGPAGRAGRAGVPAGPAPEAAAADLPPAGFPAGVAIRPMTGADAAPVLAIYQAGLDSGEASFEIQAPTWEAFDAARLPSHRHVAVDGTSGDVLGWAAVSAVSDRCVYQGVVEHSVYVAAAARGRGIGAALLSALISSTEAAGIWTIQSGIFPGNGASLRLHERAGFRVVGTRVRLGRHHGRWRDVVLLERRSARAGRD
ncbi:MAG TPA: metalloregulator ArsR/SmtB family transcription factor [Streptosporangiaceae bacterium]|nr:metalloregulator ArsR/SmtB family transcription factor [Streptosporangiaceae bacterium]